MTALLGSLLGFLGAALPDVLKLVRDKVDREHELAIMDRQMAMQQDGHHQRLEEIGTQADIAESRALYRTYYTGIRWVDALNGTVRPVLAYAFFLLYASVKLAQFEALAFQQLWTENDQMIFAGIISFYFGQRAMRKIREGR